MLILPITYTNPVDLSSAQRGLLALIQSDKEREWTGDDISLLKVLTDQISITISQAMLFEHTQKQKQELENTLLKLKDTQAQLIQTEKMASLGQLVAGVAHEINTPVGSISSNNSIFKKCTDKIKALMQQTPVNAEKAIQLLELLEETININTLASDRITDIVKSLKNFARLDESDIKKVNIHEGINSTLKLISHEIKGKVEIKTDFYDLPDIECYPNLLNQVFMNILVNAYQSINDKGTITITTEMDNNNIIVSISDTGAGISQEHLKKIFDPGFTTKGVGVGTGLGLSICYQIIEKHKGEIQVESTVGQGSKFRIYLPVKQI